MPTVQVLRIRLAELVRQIAEVFATNLRLAGALLLAVHAGLVDAERGRPLGRSSRNGRCQPWDDLQRIRQGALCQVTPHRGTEVHGRAHTVREQE